MYLCRMAAAGHIGRRHRGPAVRAARGRGGGGVDGDLHCIWRSARCAGGIFGHQGGSSRHRRASASAACGQDFEGRGGLSARVRGLCGPVRLSSAVSRDFVRSGGRRGGLVCALGRFGTRIPGHPVARDRGTHRHMGGGLAFAAWGCRFGISTDGAARDRGVFQLACRHHIRRRLRGAGLYGAGRG